MTNHINVTIESSARFRSNSAASEQKNSGHQNISWVMFNQILKAMVILTSLFGAGIAIGWVLRILERTHPTSEPNNPTPPLPKSDQPISRLAQPMSLFTDNNIPIEPPPRIVPAAIALMPYATINMTNATSVALSPSSQWMVVSDQDQLTFLNFSTPLSPLTIARLPLFNHITDVAISSDGQTLVTLSSNQVTCINITQPNTPIILSQLTLPTTTARSITLTPDNTHLLIANGINGLTLIDITTPTQPTLRGHLSLPGDTHCAALHGNTAFVGTGATGLAIVNIQDPANPTIRNTLPTDGSVRGVAISQDGHHAYLGDWNKGFKIVDITNPQTPKITGKLITLWTVGQVSLSQDGYTALVTDSTKGVQAIDVTDPSKPVLKGSSGPAGTAYKLATTRDDQLVFVASGDGGLRCVRRRDVPVIAYDHLRFAQLGICFLGSSINTVMAISLDGGFVYTTNNNLMVIDIRNLTNPSMITLNITNPGGAFIISPNNQFLIALSPLQIFNINNPLDPFLVLYSPSISISCPSNQCLQITQELLFAMNGTALDIINITNITSPTTIGSYNQGPSAFIVTKNSQLAYLLVESNLEIVDVSNPTSPILISSYNVPYGLTDTYIYLSLNEKQIYTGVGNYFGGSSIGIFDVNNISSPVLIGSVGNNVDTPYVLNGNGKFMFTSRQEGVSGNLLDILDLVSLTMDNYRFNPGTLLYQPFFQTIMVSPDEKLVIGIGVYLNDKPDYLMTIDNGPYFTEPLVFSRDFMNPKAVLKVGKNSRGKIYTGILYNHAIDAIYQINSRGQKMQLPTWFSIDSVSFNGGFGFSGTPDKALSGTNLVLEIQLKDALISSAPPRVSLSIEPSLLIDMGGNRLTIESPATIASVTIQVSDVEAGQFVLKPFGAVSASFNAQTGTLAALGVIPDLNAMLQNVAFFVSDPSQVNETSVQVTVDDMLNLPQSVTAPLTKFGFLRPPVFNSNSSLRNQTIDPLNQLIYTIPSNAFLDPYGRALTYSAQLAGGAPLPAWLSFNPNTQQFVGTVPLSMLGQQLDIVITASNGYQSVHAQWSLTGEDHNAPAFNPNSTFTNQTIQALQEFSYVIPSNTFIDKSAKSLTYSASLANGAQLPIWLDFNPLGNLFSGTPPIRTLGEVLDITITANNGYKFANAQWILTVQNHSAPSLNPAATLANQTVQALEEFSYRVPRNTFIEPEGLPLLYSAVLANGVQVPAWLDFNAIDRMFSGTPPVSMLGETMVFYLSASNGYRSARTGWALAVSPAYAPEVNGTLRDTAAIVNQAFIYPIAGGFISNNTLHYSARATSGSELYPWLRMGSTQGILSGQPTESNLGNYPVMVIASDPYGGSANQTFTIRVIDPSAASAQRLAQLQEILKIVGYAVSGAGAAFTLYKNKALIRNTLIGKRYIRPSNLFDENGMYQVSISSDDIKEVKVLERKSPQACAKKTAAALTHCLSHHLYGQVTFIQRQYEDWVRYDRRTNTIQLDIEKLPESGEWGIQLFNNDGYVLEEIALTFPWNQEIDIAESEELQASTSRRGLGDRVSPREGVEARLLQNEA